MNTHPRPISDRQRQLAIRADLDRAVGRLEATERHLVQLRNTLKAVAREAGGIEVCHPCSQCERSLLLRKDGVLYCPYCRYHHVL